MTTDNGTQFTYHNTFGGFCKLRTLGIVLDSQVLGVYDPANPFNNNAQPNSWTPPLNTSWTWGVDRIYAVNLGGLFVLGGDSLPVLCDELHMIVQQSRLSPRLILRSMRQLLSTSGH